ncbi:MAG TPA: hypothetical protein VGH33_05800 [Isosphaeraceae bacterium]
MDDYTDLMYTIPTFWGGVARIFDFGGVLGAYGLPVGGLEADRLALAADWHAVGGDLRRAIAVERGGLRRRGVYGDRGARAG